jgi:hypothetical protein
MVHALSLHPAHCLNNLPELEAVRALPPGGMDQGKAVARGDGGVSPSGPMEISRPIAPHPPNPQAPEPQSPEPPAPGLEEGEAGAEDGVGKKDMIGGAEPSSEIKAIIDKLVAFIKVWPV